MCFSVVEFVRSKMTNSRCEPVGHISDGLGQTTMTTDVLDIRTETFSFVMLIGQMLLMSISHKYRLNTNSTMIASSYEIRSNRNLIKTIFSLVSLLRFVHSQISPQHKSYDNF